jgi:hypothetical protein
MTDSRSIQHSRNKQSPAENFDGVGFQRYGASPSAETSGTPATTEPTR